MKSGLNRVAGKGTKSQTVELGKGRYQLGRVLSTAPVLMSLLACDNSRWLEEEGDKAEDLEEVGNKVEDPEESGGKLEGLGDVTKS